jgi:hypothetical protein
MAGVDLFDISTVLASMQQALFGIRTNLPGK